MTADLAIVIVSFNTRDMLRDCLRALPAAVGPLSCMTYVVDNASGDGSVEMVRAEFPGVELIASDKNLGFARANNVALERADARYLLLLNPDTEAEPGSLERLVAFMDAHPRAGACGPLLLNSDGTLQPNGRRFPTLLREVLAVTGAWRLVPRWYERRLVYGRADLKAESEVDQVSGACILVRRDAMAQVGPLDDRFFMFYEEVEWCRRIRDTGWEIWLVPAARVVHHWMGSVRRASKEMTAELFKSQLLYHKKVDSPAMVLAIRGVVALGLLKNHLLHAGVAVKRLLRRAAGRPTAARL